MIYKEENVKVTINGVELKPCYDVEFNNIITEINMEYQKDYSLLRPFDLEAASNKAPICWPCQGVEILFIGMASDNKAVIEYVAERQVQKVWPGDLRMKELAWVEGRPVYKGDVLYWNTQSIDSGSKFTATGFLEEPNYIAGVSLLSDGDRLGEDGLSGMRPENLTWQKPKTKREGWVNVYPDKSAVVYYETEKLADAQANKNRVACCKITWEE